MARPLRIEYPNAYYHVTNKAEHGTSLFPSQLFYEAFLTGVNESAIRFNVEVLGWCLLRCEYHLLVKTPEGNLSRFMRQVDGLYTQQYQKLKRRSGSVFRGRYKSVLLQAETWLAPISRYIHNLPRTVRQNPMVWQWSSLGIYMKNHNPYPALKTAEVLDSFGKGTGARENYLSYVQIGTDRDMLHFYGKKNQQSVLGDEKFRARVKLLACTSNIRGESKGTLARKRPTATKIVTSVADTFKVSGNSILHATRGPGSKNVPRWVAMYLCQEAGGITLQSIAQQFGLQRYGTVSTTIGKLKDEFTGNQPLFNRVHRIRQQLA